MRIYRSSKIVLNIHDPEAKEGLNTRTFDILACGACELVDYKKNLDMHFKPAEEIATFKDIGDLHDTVDYYSRNRDLLMDISGKGRKRVLSDHTWRHRVDDVLCVLGEKRLFSK